MTNPSSVVLCLRTTMSTTKQTTCCSLRTVTPERALGRLLGTGVCDLTRMSRGLSKKCFDLPVPDGILRLALETFLSLRVLRPTGGCSSPSPKTNVSPFAYLLVVVVLLGAVLGVGLKSARAEIIAYTDKSGRRVYVNVEDEEQ